MFKDISQSRKYLFQLKTRKKLTNKYLFVSPNSRVLVKTKVLTSPVGLYNRLNVACLANPEDCHFDIVLDAQILLVNGNNEVSLVSCLH